MDCYLQISTLNVKVSKTKAINYKTGASAELEDLRLKHRELMDEKSRLEKELQEFQTKRDEEEQKRIKVFHSICFIRNFF
jgi:predicted  nucleic acid-binding Zn-ribbon protein